MEISNKPLKGSLWITWITVNNETMRKQKKRFCTSFLHKYLFFFLFLIIIILVWAWPGEFILLENYIFVFTVFQIQSIQIYFSCIQKCRIMLRLQAKLISFNTTSKQFTKLEDMKNTSVLKFMFYHSNSTENLSNLLLS